MIIEQVKQLNAKAQALNAQRQRMVGEQETLKRQYDKNVEVIKSRFGVEVTPENLDSLYASEEERIQREALALQQEIARIDSGEYRQKPQVDAPKSDTLQTNATVDGAYIPTASDSAQGFVQGVNQTLGGQPQVAQVQQTQPQPASQGEIPPPAQGTNSVGVAQQPAFIPPAQGVIPPPAGQIPSSPQPEQVSQPSQSGLIPSSSQGAGQIPMSQSSSLDKINQDFGAILGGQQPQQSQQQPQSAEQQDISEQSVSPLNWGNYKGNISPFGGNQ